MSHFTKLLQSIKIGNQHNVTKVHVPLTKINLRFLSYLLDRGIIAGFGPSPKHKLKIIVYFYQKIFLFRNYEISERYSHSNYASNIQSIENMKIFYKPGYKKIIKLRKIKKLLKNNSKELWILNTSKGFCNLQEALKFNTGGVLVCIISF